MIKRRTLSKIFGGQVWNSGGGAIFFDWWGTWSTS